MLLGAMRVTNQRKYSGSKIYKSKLSPALLNSNLKTEQEAAIHG
jgi:hypothetical protein